MTTSSSTTLITILTSAESTLPTSYIEESLGELGLELEVVRSFEAVRPESDLVIVLQAEKLGADFNDYALRKGLTWLPVQFSHTIGRIGPIMIPQASACFECLQQRCGSNGVPAVLTPKETRFDLSWTLISSITAMETIKWVSRNTNSFVPLSLGHMIEFDAFHLQGEVNPVYKVPTCPACGARHEAHLAAQPWREAELVLEP